MCRRPGVAVLLAMLLALASAAAALGAPRGTDRPFTGSAAGFLYWTGDDPLDCGEPFRETTFGTLDGITSHLGAVGISMMHCPTFDGSAGGHIIFAGASGDELHGTYEGTTDHFPPDPGDWILATAGITLGGGTGRFAAASGSVTGHLAVRFDGFDDAEWPLGLSWEGGLDY